MEVLAVLKQAINACTSVVKWGAGMQQNARKSLVADLQTICSNCDDAYGAVLARLVPVKNAFRDPQLLSTELRALAADAATRSQFKPEHLCHQVDQLLVSLSSNLDELKYSIDFRRIKDLRQELKRFGDVDGAIYQSYDDFRMEIDRIATQILDPAFDAQERSRYAQHVIEGFEAELRSAQATMRDAKSQTVGLI